MWLNSFDVFGTQRTFLRSTGCLSNFKIHAPFGVPKNAISVGLRSHICLLQLLCRVVLKQKNQLCLSAVFFVVIGFATERDPFNCILSFTFCIENMTTKNFICSDLNGFKLRKLSKSSSFVHENRLWYITCLGFPTFVLPNQLLLYTTCCNYFAEVKKPSHYLKIFIILVISLHSICCSAKKKRDVVYSLEGGGLWW